MYRARDAAILPPSPGRPALIDPRRENPLDFLMLDLRGTFELTPMPTLQPGAASYLRAAYTIKVLRLNQRDCLPAARQNAFKGYRARLREYIRQRDGGAKREDLVRMTAGFAATPHATVWAEMKRQQQHLPELAELFAQAPEALAF